MSNMKTIDCIKRNDAADAAAELLMSFVAMIKLRASVIDRASASPAAPK